MAVSVRSAGFVIFRLDGVPKCLLLRAYHDWDFPKGLIERGESPWVAARREVREETGLSRLEFPWGEEYRETPPYGRGKVARYYLALTDENEVTLPVNPALGRPEHHEFRWAECADALALVAPRLQAVLEWACSRICFTAPARLLDFVMSSPFTAEETNMPGQESTPMKDEHYDIVSALYHSLKGVNICTKYIEDAEKEGDKEVVAFFHEVQDENRKLAMKAKDLIAKRMH